ncbi:hypothetical protein [Sphingomonas insulae]|uniref:hypothetical protein n=1 Tax=Sphingomonas insulae TaxID=424800 RepID=UPI00141B1F7F|nr:hypothetical protein [Sphingomonas insulae]
MSVNPPPQLLAIRLAAKWRLRIDAYPMSTSERTAIVRQPQGGFSFESARCVPLALGTRLE